MQWWSIVVVTCAHQEEVGFLIFQRLIPVSYCVYKQRQEASEEFVYMFLKCSQSPPFLLLLDEDSNFLKIGLLHQRLINLAQSSKS